jgi:hypothetical protein
MKQQNEEKSWDNWNFLILRCTTQDRCGGLSDRLTSIPLFLFLAASTNRVLLLRWDRPFALEEFLVPGPMMNWSVPEDLQTILDNITSSSVYSKRVYFDGPRAKKLISAANKSALWLVEGNVNTSGERLFRDLVSTIQQQDTRIQKDDEDYTTFYHEMFPALFSPTPPLQRLVDVYMKELKLVANQYTVAHYRSKYPGEPYRKTWNLTILEETVINAVHCASSLAPSLPVYVASDAVAALQAVQRYTKERPNSNRSIVSHLDISRTKYSEVTLLPEEDPPHLNFDSHSHPSGFYSIFLDLLIMASSRCVSSGAGGFGRLGSFLSFNASCQVAHSVRGKIQRCPALP